MFMQLKCIFSYSVSPKQTFIKIEKSRILVATIHFLRSHALSASLLGVYSRVFSATGTPNSTQSLLCSLFKGQCNHLHVHSLFTANGPSDCSSIHVSVGDYQHRRKTLKQTDNQIRERGANDDAIQGVHSNHKTTRMITIHFLPFTAHGSLITPITFTYSLRSWKGENHP